jgi:hypothetical protein
VWYEFSVANDTCVPNDPVASTGVGAAVKTAIPALAVHPVTASASSTTVLLSVIVTAILFAL